MTTTDLGETKGNGYWLYANVIDFYLCPIYESWE